MLHSRSDPGGALEGDALLTSARYDLGNRGGNMMGESGFARPRDEGLGEALSGGRGGGGNERERGAAWLRGAETMLPRGGGDPR